MLVLVTTSIVLYLIFRRSYILVAGLVLGAVGVFSPVLGGVIHRAWTGLSHVLGFVMGRIMLGIVYFLFLVPLSLIARVFRKKGAMKLSQSGSSYFTERTVTYTKETMEHPW